MMCYLALKETRPGDVLMPVLLQVLGRKQQLETTAQTTFIVTLCNELAVMFPLKWLLQKWGL